MKGEDFKKFSGLLLKLGQATANAELPSEEKIEMYWRALKDMELQQIAENITAYMQTADPLFFPSVARIRQPIAQEVLDREAEAEAFAVYDRIRFYIDNMYFPEFHLASMNTIRHKMERAGEAELFPLLQKWGNEVIEEKPGVVRAQFVREFKALKAGGQQYKALPASGETKQIGSIINGLLEK